MKSLLEDCAALSAMDEKRFGITTAKAMIRHVSDVERALAFSHENEVQLLIARVSVADFTAVHAMEAAGFRLMDTLVYWKHPLTKKEIPNVRDQGVRFFQPRDGDRIKAIAGRIFHDYFGHYHADPRLDRRKCDEVYESWAARSVDSRNVAKEILVAEDERGEIVGFVTLRLLDGEEGECVVGGVLPEAQGRGIYQAFIVQGMRWCLSEGMQRMVVSTQINNVAVQRVWSRLGFEPSHSYYTFHKWFNQ